MFINEHKEEYTILKMCEVLGVSPSGYYDYLKRLEREDTEREAFNRHLDERILFHFTDNHGIYSSPRIHKRLERIDNIFFFQAEDGIRVRNVTGVQTCALPI